ncbi:Dam family site-specific DNA-(adenine-N6)-methyltransferase [uncultured Paraglaciecola sp.]|uniref:Dam family site-specific DNA-(adenine-N6)-methyltransferase n=1 Tax=uncultured Paraglaciecola sp. TaxID=1765024 RepID=UPI002621C9C7|nr:Dam family site-specific DNA-(adenine-N6)-methyltransferase [uncultured Paraglaciecola sp.]
MAVTKDKKNRAFLKWAGGKYSLMEDINARLPKAKKLIEPFVGAGSVFLNTQYSKYLLNDINPDLINLYNIVKHQGAAYIKDSIKLFTPDYNDELRYYHIRQSFNESEDIYERAVYFLYLNRHGYNGLCRYNNSGKFNVPFGRYKAPYFPEKELEYFSEKARLATFTCEPFEKMFTRARKGSVIYCDPPYAPISKTAMFNSYATGGFTLDNQIKLASLARHAGYTREIPVLVSNHDTEFTRDIYQHADITKLQVSRFISQNGNARLKVAELLALYQNSI